MTHIASEFLTRTDPSEQLPIRCWHALSHVFTLGPNLEADCALFTQSGGDLIIYNYATSFSPFTLIALSSFGFLPDHMMAIICPLGMFIL